MNEALFYELLHWIKQDLRYRPASQARYLLGGGVFLGFGDTKPRSFFNGKEIIIEDVKEWVINLNTPFRLTQHDHLITGSCDHHAFIQKHLNRLIGLKFESIKFISKYLDIKITFEEGYQFTTFFDWMDDSCLPIKAPGKPNFRINCDDEESIQKVTEFGAKIAVKEEVCQTVDLSPSGITINYLMYSDHRTPSYFIQEKGTYIGFENCPWRLERDGKYVLGSGDYYSKVCLHQQMEFKKKFLEIKGQTIWRIDVLNSMGDAKMYIGDRYVLTVFTSFITSWAVYHNNEQVLYCADPVLQEDEKDINQV